jgi:hypothetical protein
MQVVQVCHVRFRRHGSGVLQHLLAEGRRGGARLARAVWLPPSRFSQPPPPSSSRRSAGAGAEAVSLKSSGGRRARGGDRDGRLTGQGQG